MIRLVALLIIINIGCGQAQNNDRPKSPQWIGGRCEGCEVIHDLKNDDLSTIDTITGFLESDEKILLNGTIYKSDGKTPAPNVILYIYHTNAGGIYEQESRSDLPGKSFFKHRGIVQTDRDGQYAFYTFLPGAYPGRTEPKHIHPIILEPGKNEYYIDDWFFEGDLLLTDAKRNNLEQRGGNGIVKLKQENSIQIATRDIILGKNIPGY